MANVSIRSLALALCYAYGCRLTLVQDSSFLWAVLQNKLAGVLVIEVT